jgi:hypothetical protein
MVPKVSRLPVDMLSQILYDRTQDVGKLYKILESIKLAKRNNMKENSTIDIERYAEVFDIIGHAVSIQDRDYKVLYQNDIHIGLVGNHIGEYCFKAYEKKNFRCDGCPVAVSFKNGCLHKTERTAPVGDTLLHVEITSSPIHDSEGNIIAGVELVKDITARKQAEIKLGKSICDLRERVKELNCLYGISKLVEKKNASLEDILQGTAKLIPPSWQYPDITCAQIVLKDKTYTTDNFMKTEWSQSQELIVNGRKSGVVEVYYLEEKPEIFEGPFLKEERDLISAIAERLGRIIEREEGKVERINLINELQKTLKQVRVLSGLIPICSSCKQIRDDKGYWQKIENYISKNSGVEFTHGICPKCAQKLYPEFYRDEDEK